MTDFAINPERLTAASSTADVCVVGAGIIGLHNALQCAKRGLRVVIVDELTNRSKNTYKVGESLLVFSNVFMRTVGGLDQEISESFEKRGVWFTHGLEGRTNFDNATEWGLQTKFPLKWRSALVRDAFGRAMFQDAQIVRPEIEARLREQVEANELIEFIDYGKARDIELGSQRNGLHRLQWRSRNGLKAGVIEAAWVIDCSGRAQFLATRFNHSIPLDDGFETSAVWGQFSGCTDQNFDGWEFTFPDGEVTRRDYNTVHLWGDGYWIWLIRLTNDRISVGVSCHKRIAPDGTNLRQVFWDIVRRYPALNFIADENMLDFGAYRSVQHISDTYVSPERYAIVGDAASIIDAYYSQGMSLALVTSWHAANIAERDIREGHLDATYIRRVNATTLADWKIMRAAVKFKYSAAIADSRFFILDHLLDYVLFCAAVPSRHRIATWLTRTNGGDTRLETPELRKLRGLLEKRLFLSRSTPFHLAPPALLATAYEQHRRVITNNALWRLAKGIGTPPLTGIMRINAPMPAIWRLPINQLRGRRGTVTPRALNPRSMESIDIGRALPLPLRMFAPLMLPVMGAAITFDVVMTGAQRTRSRAQLAVAAVRKLRQRRCPMSVTDGTTFAPEPVVDYSLARWDG